MKCFLAFFFLFVCSFSFSQIDNSRLVGVKITDKTKYSDKDSIPIVVNIDKSVNYENTIWIIDGKLIKNQFLGNINANSIEKMEVFKDSTLIKDGNKGGRIEISLKQSSKVNYISLSKLRTKYLSQLNSERVLFIVDGKTVEKDYDKFLVDENHIMKIETNKVSIAQEGIDLTLVNIISRTEENLKKANTIRIKGNYF